MSGPQKDASEIEAENVSLCSHVESILADQDRLLGAPGSRLPQSLAKVGRVSEEIEFLKAALLAKDAELRNVTDRLEEKNKLLSQRDASIAQRDKTIQEQTAAIQTLQADINQNLTQIYDLTEKVRNNETKVRERDVNILELSVRLNGSEEEVREKDADITQRDVAIAALKREKESLQATITEQCAVIGQQLKTFQKVVDSREPKEEGVMETIQNTRQEMRALQAKSVEQTANNKKLSAILENTRRIGAEYFRNTRNYGVPAFLAAARHGDFRTVEGFIAMGFDIHTRGDQNINLLHEASIADHVPVVKSLLVAGVDVDVTDSNKMTALSYASRQGNVDVVKALLDGGAKVNLRNKNGKLPRDVVCKANSGYPTATIEALMELFR